jgi:5,10-methylenetetrahydrofolate reductase
MIAVELRPPRTDLGDDASRDAWMGLHSSVRRLLAKGTPMLLTDGAVGTSEEENLHHLVTNLDADAPRELVCPFLTTKHTLEYCEWYAARALDAHCDSLTVLGGDKNVGAPRCVPHGYVLRQHLRTRFPELQLGAWANPHRVLEEQADFVANEAYSADFFLTQLVSHHDVDRVQGFQDALSARGVTLPAVWGVFFYRSANRKTLERLSQFFPIPVEAILSDFASGMSPIEICATTIRTLRSVGANKVYISNLHPERAASQLKAIMAAVDAPAA